MPFILRGRFTPRPYDSKTGPTSVPALPRTFWFLSMIILKAVAGGAKVLPRVEFGRFLREDLADHAVMTSRPSESILILHHGRLRRSRKLLGGNADRGVEFPPF